MEKFLKLLVLSFLFFENLSYSQSIVPAYYYKMMNWDSSPYKSFKLTGGRNPTYDMPFRLLWPAGYDSSSVNASYPLVIMLHGAGESAWGNDQFGNYPEEDPRRNNNDSQLKHLGYDYLKAVNNGKWPGFVLFPQNNKGSWTGGDWILDDAIEIIQTLSLTLKIDPNRIYVNGLSAGAAGVWHSIARYTNVFAAAMAFSGIELPTEDNTTKVAHMPIWYFQGDIDKTPPRSIGDQTIQALKDVGGTPLYTVYPETAHTTWYKAFAEPDFLPFMLRHSLLSIHAYFGKTTFESNEIVNVKLGIAPGFSAYEWKRDGVLIPDATSNQIIATSSGTYTVRFKRADDLWTDWSEPLVIVSKTPPVFVTQPVSIIRVPGQSVTFSVGVSGLTPLTYQWQKDGVNINGANSNILTLPNVKLSDKGSYRVIVSNSLGKNTSNYATLNIDATYVVAISSPSVNNYYKEGQSIFYSGQVKDSQGVVNNVSYMWKLEYHQGQDTSTIWTKVDNGADSFVVPITSDTAVNVFYRLKLIATDAYGRASSTYRDIYPLTAHVMVKTEPAGLKIALGSYLLPDSYSFNAVEGTQMDLQAVTPQVVNGKTYRFSYWKHGGDPSQTISISSKENIYTAIYVVDDPLGTEEEMDILQNVNIFPNPTSLDYLRVNLPPLQGETVAFMITNSTGQTSKPGYKKVDQNTFEINVAHLRGGLYVLKTQQGKKIHFKNFIVIR